jgi:hypothetical protein
MVFVVIDPACIRLEMGAINLALLSSANGVVPLIFIKRLKVPCDV